MLTSKTMKTAFRLLLLCYLTEVTGKIHVEVSFLSKVSTVC